MLLDIKQPFTRFAYCRYLVGSLINCTPTGFAAIFNFVNAKVYGAKGELCRYINRKKR
jgi:hypothetical protein